MPVAHRCKLQNGLRIATCEELLESSTCAALRGICYPADVSQLVTPLWQSPDCLAPADAPLSPCLPADLRCVLQREPAADAAASLASAARTSAQPSAQPSATLASTLAPTLAAATAASAIAVATTFVATAAVTQPAAAQPAVPGH